VAACFVLAWLDIAIHRVSRPRPSQQEMRRFMLCGIYCNPDDPRPIVHRPLGRGYTLNLRRELLVVTLIVMAVLAMAAAALMCAVPAAS
jgi:uncharacterized membrane protein